MLLQLRVSEVDQTQDFIRKQITLGRCLCLVELFNALSELCIHELKRIIPDRLDLNLRFEKSLGVLAIDALPELRQQAGVHHVFDD